MLQELKIKDDEEPFYVVDVGDVVLKWKEWKEAMPRVEPFYAVKCNPDVVLLHVLAALGVNFDCSTKKEIETVLNVGVQPSRIIYANTCKGISHLKYADHTGVDLMTFDNEAELHKIKKTFPDARLVLRIKVDDSGSILKLSLKFGCELDEVSHLLDVAKDLNLNVVGVSFHVGCNCQEPLAYHKAIESAKNVFGLGRDRGFNMNVLDIGGGFPGHRDHAISFTEFASAINEALDVHFPPGCGVKILAEPGRYFMTSAFTLLANVIGKREVPASKKTGANILYTINEGVYGAFNNLIYHNTKWKPTPLVDTYDKLKLSVIWGPTCDSVDQVAKNALLPDMEVGDWIAFENIGSYTTACASNFNGFAKTSTRYLISAPFLAYFQQLPSWTTLREIFSSRITQV
ncbi:ornithine decarboxylase [Trichonephila inaurata madagascariensis]|uniref:ornithine decarboxylase n=1 Tax=Trichonephila inaurata madagascariensis TaxID=2747483 RepID=A0A8X6MJP2_9ARAC|nr:ornithine decarboxylase [Trichonephila inaurata madagascariensis]